MLTLEILGEEFYNEGTSEFSSSVDYTLEFEHSLVSLSKWESIHEKPFLSEESKTTEETLSYVNAMLLTPDPPEDYLQRLTQANFEKISKYIDAKHSATTFPSRPSGRSREMITSELIYYWMFSARIPIECETWHLNRLFTLLRVFAVKGETPKKMSRAEQASQMRDLNAKRKAQLGTRG